VSPDVIGMIIALFAFTVAVLGGVAGMLARQTKSIDARLDRLESSMDARFERVDSRFEKVDTHFERAESSMDTRFEKVDTHFERVESSMDTRFERVDAHFERIEDELAAVKGELVEVKVAIARLEGPLPRLQRL
jgi:chromosome segregation ATPase